MFTIVHPRLEWMNMYGDSWRMLRDYFYDKNMHGLGEGRDARIEGNEQIRRRRFPFACFCEELRLLDEISTFNRWDFCTAKLF